VPPEDPGRPFAFVLSHFSAQARGRLLALLPDPLRERVTNAFDEVSDIRPVDMTFVEQVLNTDLERLEREISDLDEQDLLVEVLPLQVCDVLSFVLLHASPQQAGEVFLRLPPTLQGEVLHRISVQTWEALGRRLGRGELEFLDGFRKSWDTEGQPASPEFSAAMLGHIPSPAAKRRLLTELDRLDPEATARIQEILFTFEDLVRLPDREFQEVLFGTDPWDLALALRTASAGLRRRVLSNISDRRQRYLLEDEVSLQDMEEEEVVAVQRQILEKARVLFERGKISTYLGSIQKAQEALEEDEEEQVSGENRSSRRKHVAPERNFRPVYIGLGLTALTLVIVIRFLNWGSGSHRNVERKSRSAFFGESTKPRGNLKEKRIDRSQRSAVIDQEEPDLALLEGDVELFNRDTQKDVSERELEPGDWVETGMDSRAVVNLYAEGGQIQMESETAVRVGEEGENRAIPPRLKVRLGNMWIFVKNPAVEVHSPLALFTATQGALYRLRVVLDATTTVNVNRGTVWIKSLVSEGKPYLVLGPGETLRLDPGGGSVRLDDESPGDWLGLF
jgi:flagellar motor switch protein FliG